MTAETSQSGKPPHNDTGLSVFEIVPISQLISSATRTSATHQSWRPKRSEFQIWLFNTAEPALAEEQLTDVLSADEVQRAERFHFAEHRSRFIAAHGITRLILAACNSGAARDLVFATGANNKPRLRVSDPSQSLSFNLSHSGCWALLVVAAEGDIGVDIEEIRTLDRMERLAQDTFARSEATELAELDEARRLEGFFACWTRKEALIKADGRGLEIPLDSFEVNVAPDAPAALLRANGVANAINAYGIWDVSTIEGYRAAVAIPRGPYDFKYYCIV